MILSKEGNRFGTELATCRAWWAVSFQSKILFLLLAIWIGSLVPIGFNFAAESDVSLTEQELRSLARELAPKVNLFAAVWAIDPEAEFYAGTTRDFTYWILKQIRGAKNKTELSEKIKVLKSREVIDIREIVGGESDIDVMTKSTNTLADMRGIDWGVKKLDLIDFERTNKDSMMGRSEVDQGFIPVEKLRLSKSAGLNLPDHFGNGVDELLSGRLSIHFSDPTVFWRTHYALEETNHPVLLAIRYIRILAQDYFNRYGQSYPNLKELLNTVSPEVQKQIESLFHSALADEKFQGFIKNGQGNKWLNASLLKSFRSYTNPTAAYLLLKHFKFDEVVAAYSDLISPINQFLFLEHRDWNAIRKKYKDYAVLEFELLTPVRERFPDFKIYHGAGSLSMFRGILFQGVLPSEGGSAGAGLYGVSKENIQFAIDWSRAKSKREDLVVELTLDPRARIMNISSGKGLELYTRWLAHRPVRQAPDDPHSDFAREFGIDILEYPYSPQAFVVKNSGVIRSTQGHQLRLKSLHEIVTEAKALNESKLPEFLRSFVLASVIPSEVARVLSVLPNGFLKHSFESGSLLKSLKTIPSIRDRLQAFYSLLQGAKLKEPESDFSLNFENSFFSFFEDELEGLDLGSTDVNELSPFINLMPPKKMAAIAENLKNTEVRRWLFKFVIPDLWGNFFFKNEWMEDHDSYVRTLAATDKNWRLSFDEEKRSDPNFEKSLKIIFQEASNPLSAGQELALKRIGDLNRGLYLRGPHLLEGISKLAESNSSAMSVGSKVELLRLLTKLLSFVKPRDSLPQLHDAINRFFKEPENLYPRFFSDPDLYVRVLAADGFLRHRVFNEDYRRSDRSESENLEDLFRATDIVLEGIQYDGKTGKDYEIKLVADHAIQEGFEYAPHSRRWMGDRLWMGLQNDLYPDDEYRARALERAFNWRGINADFDQILLKLSENQKYPTTRILALAFLVRSRPQTAENLRFLRELLDAYSREGPGNSRALIALLEQTGKMSELYAKLGWEYFSKILDPEKQRLFADVLFGTEANQSWLAPLYFEKMNKGPVSVQNEMAKQLLLWPTAYQNEALEKLLSYVEVRVQLREVAPHEPQFQEYNKPLAEAVSTLERVLRKKSELISSAMLSRFEALRRFNDLDQFTQAPFRMTILEFLMSRAKTTPDHCPESLKGIKKGN